MVTAVLYSRLSRTRELTLGRVGRPRYVEIADDLRRRLNGAKAGDPLPSESELSNQFGVSRLTARQAVKVLEAEGRVYRVAGSGTFATGSEAHRTMSELRSFTEEMRLRGIDVTSRMLESGWAETDGRVRADLELAEGARAIRVSRVRLGDGRPMAVETAYLHPRCSFLLDFDLSAMSMHALLEARGIVPTEAIGTLVAVSAEERDAELLDIEVGSPLLVERRRIDDQHGVRLESTETRYVGSMYVFDVNLRRSAGTPTSRG